MAAPQNWLDVFVVSMSVLDMAVKSVPSWLVRLMRALRVIRLFGRVPALRKMITAVSASVFAMLNAFVILVITISICAPPLPPASPPSGAPGPVLPG